LARMENVPRVEVNPIKMSKEDRIREGEILQNATPEELKAMFKHVRYSLPFSLPHPPDSLSQECFCMRGNMHARGARAFCVFQQDYPGQGCAASAPLALIGVPCLISLNLCPCCCRDSWEGCRTQTHSGPVHNRKCSSESPLALALPAQRHADERPPTGQGREEDE
jgi:hypothetical protein